MVAAWRYLAFRVLGDGTEVLLHGELPLSDVKLTGVLSGPPRLTATIATPYRSLRGSDGLPLLNGRDTAIYAEADGLIRGGWLLDDPAQGDTLQLTGYGFTGYAASQPYPGDFAGVQVDPADVVRLVWTELQAQPGGNIGLVVDGTTTPVRVGYPDEEVSFTAGGLPRKTQAAQAIRDRMAGGEGFSEDWTWPGAPAVVGEFNDELLDEYGRDPLDLLAAVAWLDNYIYTHPAATTARDVTFDTGPYRLNWWSTDDCGRAIDDLARTTPFDYLEHHTWNAARTQVLHRLQLAHPRVGRRRTDLRFVVGENVPAMPEWGGGEGPVNEVRVLGAGEGRDMVHATAGVVDGRLRRVAQISDRDITTAAAAAERARRELAARRGLLGVRTIAVRDHPNAPIGSWSVGDEIQLQGEGAWGDVNQWFRIVGSTIQPGAGEAAVLEVIQSDTQQ